LRPPGEADLDEPISHAIDTSCLKRTQASEHGVVDVVVDGLRTLHDGKIEALSEFRRGA
jgi:hypothetical protein